MKCIRCDVDMVLGRVIKPAEESGYISAPVAPINGRTLELITCWKCPQCGQPDYINTDSTRKVEL